MVFRGWIVLSGEFTISLNEMFKRGQDPKIALDLGIKEKDGYNISHISDENTILPGINPKDIYVIMHSGSNSVSGFCSGKKLMKVLLSLMTDPFPGFRYKWLWDPYHNSSGGSLYYHYSSDGKFWTDANNTRGYSFRKMGKDKIMEL